MAFLFRRRLSPRPKSIDSYPDYVQRLESLSATRVLLLSNFSYKTQNCDRLHNDLDIGCGRELIRCHVMHLQRSRFCAVGGSFYVTGVKEGGSTEDISDKRSFRNDQRCCDCENVLRDGRQNGLMSTNATI